VSWRDADGGVEALVVEPERDEAKVEQLRI
jgi:hypothetical protein